MRVAVAMLAIANGCGGATRDVIAPDLVVDALADDAPLALDPSCGRGVAVEALTACLATAGPDACRAIIDRTLCDDDGDGVADDLEAAIARAYAPVFAFNAGGSGGAPETSWPASAKHFVSHARLLYRGAGESIVDPLPTLESLASSIVNGVRRADDPAFGRGADFWLCLGHSVDATRIPSSERMRALPDGVDVVSVVHPGNGALASSTHLFASFSLLFPYNTFRPLGDHEGDWEGIAVFINRTTGAVDAAWFERHDSNDDRRFVDVTNAPPRDPAEPSAAHGLRFWDFAGARRHVVAYVATGSHAMYDHPGHTRLFPLGPRDAHHGDGVKLLPWLGRLVRSFRAAPESGDVIAVHPQNVGEKHRAMLPWARFRGQWGCSDGVLGKSWPGPFGNARHARPMFERAWGSPPRG